ncbi:LysR family transcriptional regulator [Cytobacillus purgationiresistens]|uniref:DNA-binding transcriptional LysR family regulator n=1 Tax=Cytobacillus purgationiresistens TaxID=863449 RepID=A0ABU0APB1_9BACI|nr:LysR family transcriptional regulator [Cytobacillus purgationiresistens]MDQ0271895.1 DNA-binding transcriptional LysR family regulator [Cytobacillus purgationiresistens]
MTFEQLRHFIEVAKTKSLTTAANNLYVSLSALSQSISGLESELDIVLFKRLRSGAKLTTEGELLIKKAEEIMTNVDEFKEMAMSYTDILQGHIRIATIPGPATALLSAVFAFKKENPNVIVELQELGPKEITHRLLNEEVDVGKLVSGSSFDVNEDRFHFEPLLNGKLVIGVQSGSLLAQKGLITTEDLKRHEIVLYQDDYLNETMNRLLDERSRKELIFQTNHTSAITHLVSTGEAITIGLDYSFLGIPGITMVQLQELENELVHYGWVHLKKKHMSKITKAFIRRLNHEISKVKP